MEKFKTGVGDAKTWFSKEEFEMKNGKCIENTDYVRLEVSLN